MPNRLRKIKIHLTLHQTTMCFTLFYSFFLLSVLLPAESCSLAHTVQVSVPRKIPAGYVISQVDFENCDIKSLHFTSSDRDFAVVSERNIETLVPVTVAPQGHTFSIWAQDPYGEKSKMDVHLVHNTAIHKRSLPNNDVLRRSKRRWSPPPFALIENDAPPFPKELDRVVSDSEATRDVYYKISGPGVDAHPAGLFTVDRNSGMLSVHRTVDREEFPIIIFEARVFDRRTNEETDLALPITVEIIDLNDNKPTFTGPLQFTVLEQTKAGTVVGKINATDRDKENTLHTKIRYSLLSGTDMFAISPEEGVITTRTNTLDREVKDKYLVTVQIKDMDGQPKGLSNSATATITVGDINDNPPTFRKQSYNVNVEENTKESLILRIPVDDKDLVNTPNWYSQFMITKGNENGYLRIDTDPKTNEGLLYVTKPLNYEKARNLNLEIMARNQAELSNSKAPWVSIPVEVAVKNVDEGPEFTAPTIRFIVKENTPNGTLIGSYTAVDPETKDSKGIKYYNVNDPALWINVDRDSGELRVANTIDRESQYVQAGIYNITMNAVDASSKTGTGTVIIHVEDVNDNIPQLPTNELLVCEKEGELSSVLVVAEDIDQSPFASPFSFEMPEEYDGTWTVKRFNDTTARVEQTADLPTGTYTVPLVVKDLQGYGKRQEVTVRVCQCLNGACLTKPSSVSLGPLAILTMLLPFVLLLLLCLLLIFFCVTKNEMKQFENMGDMGGILLKSNTEAPGEQVDSNLIIGSMSGMEQTGKGSVKDSLLNVEFVGNKNASTIGGFNVQDHMIHQSSAVIQSEVQNGHYPGMYVGNQFGTAQFGRGQFVQNGGSFDHFQDSTLHQTWQTNGRYLQEKLAYLGGAEEGCYADDILHEYGFEGVGSVAGSVGCCSDQVNSDDLDFLNTLGPKFKSLAHVCTNK